MDSDSDSEFPKASIRKFELKELWKDHVYWHDSDATQASTGHGCSHGDNNINIQLEISREQLSSFFYAFQIIILPLSLLKILSKFKVNYVQLSSIYNRVSSNPISLYLNLNQVRSSTHNYYVVQICENVFGAENFILI